MLTVEIIGQATENYRLCLFEAVTLGMSDAPEPDSLSIAFSELVELIELLSFKELGALALQSQISRSKDLSKQERFLLIQILELRILLERPDLPRKSKTGDGIFSWDDLDHEVAAIYLNGGIDGLEEKLNAINQPGVKVDNNH